MELHAFLMIGANVILIFSLPLLLRLLSILVKRSISDFNFESDFYRCIKHILLVDLVNALITIFAVEPAAYGLFDTFYETNAGWISKIVIFQSSPLCILSIYFHCLIALNRLTAMIFTLNHQRIWTPCVLKFCHSGGWFIAVFLSLPLIWPIQGSFITTMSPLGTRGLVFVILGNIENVVYQVIPVATGVFFEIVILISYCIIVVKVRKHEELTNVVTRTTIASVLMCFSGWFLVLLRGTVSFYGHIFHENLFSIEVYHAIFKIGHAINGSITSLITILLFRDIRSRVFSCCSYTRSAEIHHESDITDSSQRAIQL